MNSEELRHEQEAEELKREIDEFLKEKERVRAIVGRIGGVPTFTKKLYNILFIVFVLICLVISLVSGGMMRLLMIELAIAALSLKFIYLIVNQARMNHFQLWMMTSIEWRINEIIKMIKNKD